MMIGHEIKYRYTVSVFFFRVKDSSRKDGYFHKCKVCGSIFIAAPEAKKHFETHHARELQRAAYEGLIESRIISLHEKRSVNALDAIRKHKSDILRKIDREDLLEVLK
jgi:hypothetical protein